MGNGLGFWNTMPLRLRSLMTSTPGLKIESPLSSISPPMRTPSIRSFMRLTHRSRVVLQQPDGPINEVTLPLGTDIEIRNRACLAPYQRLKSCICSTASWCLTPL